METVGTSATGHSRGGPRAPKRKHKASHHRRPPARGKGQRRDENSGTPRTYEVNFLEILILQYDLLVEKLHLPAIDRDFYENLFLFKLRNYISSSAKHRHVAQDALRADTRIGPLIGGLELVLRGLKEHWRSTLHALQHMQHREDIVSRLLACSRFYDENRCLLDDAAVSFLMLLQEHQRSTVLVMSALRKWQENFSCSPQLFCWCNGQSYIDRILEDVHALHYCTVGHHLGLNLIAYPCNSNIPLKRLTHRKQLMRVAKLVRAGSVMDKGLDPCMCPEAVEYFDESREEEGKTKTKTKKNGRVAARSHSRAQSSRSGSRSSSLGREDRSGAYQSKGKEGKERGVSARTMRGGGGGGRKKKIPLRRSSSLPEAAALPSSRSSHATGVAAERPPSHRRCGAAGQWRRHPHEKDGSDGGDGSGGEEAALAIPYGAPPSRVAAMLQHSSRGREESGRRSLSSGHGTVGGRGRPLSVFGEEETIEEMQRRAQQLILAEKEILNFSDAVEERLRQQIQWAEEKNVFLPLLRIPFLCIDSTFEGVPPGAVSLEKDVWPDVLDASHCAAFGKDGKTAEMLPGSVGEKENGASTAGEGGEGGSGGDHRGGEEYSALEEDGDVSGSVRSVSSRSTPENNQKKSASEGKNKKDDGKEDPSGKKSPAARRSPSPNSKEDNSDAYSDGFDDTDEDKAEKKSTVSRSSSGSHSSSPSRSPESPKSEKDGDHAPHRMSASSSFKERSAKDTYSSDSNEDSAADQFFS